MAKKDAIQQDVSDNDVERNEDGDVVGNNERLAEINEIAEARRRERDGESDTGEADQETGETDNDSGTDAGDVDVDDAGDTGGGEDTPPDDAGEPVITLIVDGKEVQRKQSEVLEAGQRALQKESTADQRLEEATRLLREAEQRAAQTPPPDKGAEQQDQSPSGGPDAIDYKQIVKTIQYGDEDEAAEALENLMAQGRAEGATQAETPSREEIIALLDEKAAFDSAVADFQKPADQGGFGDLWEDPILRSMVIQKETELLEKGDTRPYGERFTEIGKEIREWLDGKTGKPTQNNLQDRQEKLKEQPDTVQGSSQRLSNESRQEPKPKTRAEIIEEMAAKRGQQT